MFYDYQHILEFYVFYMYIPGIAHKFLGLQGVVDGNNMLS